MFDGWSEEGSYFVAIFALYPAPGILGYEACLLSFFPLENETDSSANEHEELFLFV